MTLSFAIFRKSLTRFCVYLHTVPFHIHKEFDSCPNFWSVGKQCRPCIEFYKFINTIGECSKFLVDFIKFGYLLNDAAKIFEILLTEMEDGEETCTHIRSLGSKQIKVDEKIMQNPKALIIYRIEWWNIWFIK